jgi:hypothetical protein
MLDRIKEMEMIVESPFVEPLFRRHNENAPLADALKMKECPGERSCVLKDVRQVSQHRMTCREKGAAQEFPGSGSLNRCPH